VSVRDLSQLLSDDLEDYRQILNEIADETERIGEVVGDTLKLARHTIKDILDMHEQLYLKLRKAGEGKHNRDEILQAYENLQRDVNDLLEFLERKLVDAIHDIDEGCHLLGFWENKIREEIFGFKDTRQE